MTAKALLLFTALTSVGYARAQTAACIAKEKHADVSLSFTRQELEQLAGRKLTNGQVRWINHSKKLSKSEYFTLEQLAAQDRELIKAGFSMGEIDNLRANGALGKGRMVPLREMPQGFETIEVAIRPVTREVLKDVRAGKKQTYVIDENGQMWVVPHEGDFSSKAVTVLKSKDADGRAQTVIVREHGVIEFNDKTSRPTFIPKSRWEMLPDETEAIMARVRAVMPEADFEKPVTPENNASRIMDCYAVSNMQRKHFVRDNLIAGNLVTTGAIITGELKGDGRLNTADGRAVIAMDFVGNNIASYAAGSMNARLAERGAGLIKFTAANTAYTAGQNYLQNIASAQLLSQDAEKKSSDVMWFNNAHFAARLPVNYAINKGLMTTLPDYLYDACRKDKKLRFLISPGVVRVFERYGSSVIYYQLRKRFIDE